ncbi:MAG: FAD-binding oxidoreductase [Phyllobacteriaceae bacterium]|nr:FAD-binding oxidoreductase [Phyllobacteriaceae bacterium]
MATAFESFGRIVRRPRKALGAGEAMALLRTGKAPAGGLLGFGAGRSYGDSCHIDSGVLANMREMQRILSVEAAAARVTVEAGALLRDVIEATRPHGLFPPVVPGTELITVGGAVANDIHGKNHHRRGTFGAHVDSLTLLRSDGKEYRCSAAENPGLFAATIGGMGLTGLILTVTLRMMRVDSADVIETVTPFDAVETYFDHAEEADAAHEYSVAWIDQLAGGKHSGRGLLMTGDHAEADAPSGGGRGFKPRVPFAPPVSPLNRPGLTLFNAAFRFMKTRKSGPHVTPYRGFFFPLDGVADWNLLYGPSGLFQHQSVVPFAATREVVPMLLAATREAGQASFLTVLKRFGAMKSPALLSFPRPGYTLTLDFPNRGDKTRKLLDRLDAITIDAGGAVNPYKDARMPAHVFARSFPNWEELEAWRDPAFASDFWNRTARVLPRDLQVAAE